MIKKIDIDFSHTDERGSICQVLSIPNSQVNYLFTKKNVKRGMHYHKMNKEYFYVVDGKVKIHGEDVLHAKSDVTHEFSKGDLFVIEPYCLHELDFIEDTQMVAVYDKGVVLPDGKKDIYQ